MNLWELDESPLQYVFMLVKSGLLCIALKYESNQQLYWFLNKHT